jgi:DNA-binding response OmpR family regulator
MSFTKQQRILVVDDDPDVNLTMKVALKGEGFEDDTFNSPLN